MLLCLQECYKAARGTEFRFRAVTPNRTIDTFPYGPGFPNTGFDYTQLQKAGYLVVSERWGNKLQHRLAWNGCASRIVKGLSALSMLRLSSKSRLNPWR